MQKCFFSLLGVMALFSGACAGTSTPEDEDAEPASRVEPASQVVTAALRSDDTKRRHVKEEVARRFVRDGLVQVYSDSWSHFFQPRFVATTPSQCAVTTVKARRATDGVCRVTSCDGTPPPPPTFIPAGTVTVAGALVPLSASPLSNGSYAPLSGSGPAFLAGDRLRVSVQGQAPIAPLQQRIYAPPVATITTTFAPTLDRAQDLGVDWDFDRSASRPDQIMKLNVVDETFSKYVDCDFPTRFGHAEIPTAALQLLPAGVTFLIAQSASLVVRIERGTRTNFYLTTQTINEFTAFE